MDWRELHPVVKILIITISCIMAVGGLAYINFIVNEALDKQDAKKKQVAQKPVRFPVRMYDRNSKIVKGEKE
jgi:flagellar basal body-associated protein FliL